VRSIAIDFGSRRIGLALSDAGGRLATPYDVLSVSSPRQAIPQIHSIIEREGVQRVVVGLPLNMDGSIGPQARSTIDWARTLGQVNGASPAGMHILFVDERLSSFDAEQQLVQRKRGGERLTRKRKKEQLDAIAAATFLQQFLDGDLPPLTP
jgi:putative holliday junction resolvase